MTGQQAWPIDNIERRDDGSYSVKLRECGTRIVRTADELAAAGITSPADPINFDTLPDGTVVRYCDGNIRIKINGGWFDQYGTGFWPRHPTEYTVVHVPAPPSKLDALHTLGYTTGEIIEVANKPSPPYSSRFLDACRDAAREAQAGPRVHLTKGQRQTLRDAKAQR